MSAPVSCPALIISAPASGSGKTTITAAIARYYRQQGKKVRIFKTGPDFIDPMILNVASDHPVYQLDLWMVGKEQCAELLYEAAQIADLILIEGVMGLFDGTPSTADLSQHFNIPVLAVIDGSAMAQTFGAIALGLEQYNKHCKLAGVIANRIASEPHADMIAQSMPAHLPLLGCFYRDAEITLAERHLGLVQAHELHDIDVQLLKASTQVDRIIANQPSQQCKRLKILDIKPVEFLPVKNSVFKLHQALTSKHILIVSDIAFNFLYKANIRLLKQAGATISYVSALHDVTLPDADALYIPGGYPELYADKISANTPFINALTQFANQKKPILAECGGLLLLLKSLTTHTGTCHNMAGILVGHAQMNEKLTAIGQQYADFSSVFNTKKGETPLQSTQTPNYHVKGHSFHYSSADIACDPVTTAQYPTNTQHRQGEHIYWQDNILASYMHWYFPSNPEFICAFFNDQLLPSVSTLTNSLHTHTTKKSTHFND